MDDTPQNPSGCGSRLGTASHVSALQDGLGKFEVPIAKRTPDEMIEPVRSLIEAIAVECRGNFVGTPRRCRGDPAVNGQPAIAGSKVGDKRAAVHLQVPRCVP